MAIVLPQINTGAYIGKGLGEGMQKGISNTLETLQKLRAEDLLSRQQYQRQKEQYKGTMFEGLEGLEPSVQAAYARNRTTQDRQAFKNIDVLNKITRSERFWSQILPGASRDLIEGLASASDAERNTFLISVLQDPEARERMKEAQALGMPYESQQIEKPSEPQSTKSSPEKTKPKKKLTANIVDAFLKKSNNDPMVARQMAIKYGYEV